MPKGSKESWLFFAYSQEQSLLATVPPSQSTNPFAVFDYPAAAAAAARRSSPTPSLVGPPPPSPTPSASSQAAATGEDAYAELPAFAGLRVMDPAAAAQRATHDATCRPPMARRSSSPAADDTYAELPGSELTCPHCRERVNTDFFADCTDKQILTNTLPLRPILSPALVTDMSCFSALLARTDAQLLNPKLNWRQDQLTSNSIYIYSMGCTDDTSIYKSLTDHLRSQGTPAQININPNDIILTRILLQEVRMRWHTTCFMRYRQEPAHPNNDYATAVRIFET